jgi:hypothetical protein
VTSVKHTSSGLDALLTFQGNARSQVREGGDHDRPPEYRRPHMMGVISLVWHAAPVRLQSLHWPWVVFVGEKPLYCNPSDGANGGSLAGWVVA